MDVEKKRVVSLVIASVVMLMIASVRGATNTFDYFDLKESSRVLELAVQDLETEVKELNMEIERVRESPIYAKKLLRDRYHITDEGERIIFFAD